MKTSKNMLFLIILVLFLGGCKTYEVMKPIINESKLESENSKLKPGILKKGDTIGLVAPGSYISQNQLDESIKNFEELGYKVKYNNSILDKHGYLAGFDKDRAQDIHSMFLDSNVKAVVAVRGGYGCARLLPYLDYELIRKNPKIVMGYSDITSLLYGLYSKTGLVSFHGPVGTSTFNEYSVNHLNNTVAKINGNYEMKNLPDEEDKITVIKNGVAEGELIGGNLSIVVSMIGTEYDIDTENKIIFLEDIGEEPYRIDRMLTQMRQSGKFNKCSGVVLGIFRRCEIDQNDPEFENSLTLKQVLQDRLGDLGIPVIYGMSFGHITNKFTLPFGINAKIDTYNKSLTLLESPVQ